MLLLFLARTITLARQTRCNTALKSISWVALTALTLVACGAKNDASTGASPAPSGVAAPDPGSRAAVSVPSTAGPAQAGPPAGPASGPPAPPVSVSTVKVQQRDIPVEIDATGTVASLSSVDVKPQVSSVIVKVHVKEGQFVRRGEPLFTLDSRADEANLAKARAQLQKDEAALADAQRQLTRSRDLLSKNFISQGAVDTTQTAVEAAGASVSADRAAIDSARVAVSYNTIAAPSAGRLGTLNAFAGSFVQPSGAALVSLTQLDPIAVSFAVPQRYLPELLPLLKTGDATVLASLPGDAAATVAARKGRMRFVDNAIDTASGTVKVKAEFANADQALWPGAYVNVRLTVQTLKAATVIPQGAIIESPRGKIVYVVDATNKVAPRAISIVFAAGLDAAVSGVKVGEKIVLDGRQNVRPGSTVVDRGADRQASKGGDKSADKGTERGTERGTEKSAESPTEKAAPNAMSKP